MARTNAVHDRNILGFSFFFAEPYALLRRSGQPHYLTEWQRGISRSRWWLVAEPPAIQISPPNSWLMTPTSVFCTSCPGMMRLMI